MKSLQWRWHWTNFDHKISPELNKKLAVSWQYTEFIPGVVYWEFIPGLYTGNSLTILIFLSYSEIQFQIDPLHFACTDVYNTLTVWYVIIKFHFKILFGIRHTCTWDINWESFVLCVFLPYLNRECPDGHRNLCFFFRWDVRLDPRVKRV